MFLGLRTAVYQAQDLGKAREWYGKVLGSQPYFDQPFYAGRRDALRYGNSGQAGAT
jgi:hypothetical protein